MKLILSVCLIFSSLAAHAGEGSDSITFIFSSDKYKKLESDLAIGDKGSHLASISYAGNSRNGCDVKETFDLSFYNFDTGEQKFTAVIFRDACNNWSRLSVDIVKNTTAI